jgi:RND family efflux transporter MFP subunit
VTVFPRSTGMVAEILFEPGEAVEAGAVLVRLDDDAEQIALERAEVTLADARAKAERYETLAGNKAISAVERDAARSELASAELAVREAQLALDRREIHAPFAGVVGLTAIETGEMVSAQTEIATIDERATLKVEFRVPEAFAAKVALGQTVDAETPSRPGEVFAGTVTAVGSRIEADSRTLVVQAAIANTGDQLRPGMSFRVILHFSGDDKTAVPALSLQWDREGSYVWRVIGDKVERVPVTIVERTVESVLVEGALAAGDRVVVEGVQRLRPGATVALADEPGASPAAAPAPAERRG